MASNFVLNLPLDVAGAGGGAVGALAIAIGAGTGWTGAVAGGAASLTAGA